VANDQNLRPVKSKSEARALGRNGGIASGKARRAKKLAEKTYSDAMKKLMQLAYRTDLSTDDVKQTCEAFGLNPTQTGALALAFSDFSRALNGDEASMERVLKATGISEGEDTSSQFETPTIYVMPSAKDGEDAILLDREAEDDAGS
jgi:hypothetical protein